MAEECADGVQHDGLGQDFLEAKREYANWLNRENPLCCADGLPDREITPADLKSLVSSLLKDVYDAGQHMAHTRFSNAKWAKNLADTPCDDVLRMEVAASFKTINSLLRRVNAATWMVFKILEQEKHRANPKRDTEKSE